METGMQVFSAETFGSVRVIENAGELFFVAKDVLRALEYADDYNPSRAIQAVPEEWKGVHRIHTPGGEQEMLTLSEQGLYFFLARSDKPKALPYQKWIAGEVMPSIRKTGSYSMPAAPAKAEISIQSELECAMLILRAANISGNQLAIAADNYYRNRTGMSALELSGTQLIAPQQEQLLTPTQLGQLMGGLSAKKVNQLLIDEGYQRRLPGGALEPTAKGLEAGAVLMDTGKRHSSGTPVCQLKWRSGMAGKIASAA